MFEPIWYLKDIKQDKPEGIYYLLLRWRFVYGL